jgi:hypothetical protein
MGVTDGGGGGSQIMGVTVGVAVGLGAVVGGGGGSQIMGVTDGGGGGSQITGPRRQETLVPP